ncbi:MAG: hypothetical protein CSA70_04815 [Rhodobacterales bacterium]|nr:MAG: hypothetical protein CSA70_04815 [Rhodobacterales bacterium]
MPALVQSGPLVDPGSIWHVLETDGQPGLTQRGAFDRIHLLGLVQLFLKLDLIGDFGHPDFPKRLAIAPRNLTRARKARSSLCCIQTT